jgi:hypothetical protein
MATLGLRFWSKRIMAACSEGDIIQDLLPQNVQDQRACGQSLSGLPRVRVIREIDHYIDLAGSIQLPKRQFDSSSRKYQTSERITNPILGL